MSYTPSQDIEKFLESLEIKEPSHYDRIPAILDYLTYVEKKTDKKTGEISYFRKKLSSEAKDLYRILKQRGGRVNKSWASFQTYADQLGCDPDSISKYLKILQMPFEQLEGNSLIEIETRYTQVKEENREFAKPQHIIEVNHIWDYNHAFMENQDTSIFPKKCEPLTEDQYNHAIEKMRQPSLKSEIVDKLGGTPKISEEGGGVLRKFRKSSQGGTPKISDVNRLHYTDNHVISHYTADAVPVNFQKKIECRNVEEVQSWLLSIGFDIGCVKKMLKNYMLHEFELARRYLISMKTFKKNPLGYYQNILKNKWHFELEG